MGLDKDKKEFGGWWLYILFLVIISVVALAVLSYTGKVGGTFIERKVFEQSYQRNEGLKSQMLTWQAQLAQINSKLMYAEPGTQDYINLSSQKAMLEVQIAQTEGMK